MNHKRARLSVLLGVLVLGAPGSALWAQQFIGFRHQPKPEESLSHIALIYYGKPDKYIHLVAANRLPDPDHLPLDRSLVIPTVWTYVLKKGETIHQVAARYLKASRHADFLAWVSKLRSPKEAKPGSALSIPFLIEHKAAKDQTFAEIAARYYDDVQAMGMLKKFNSRQASASSLKAGETIFVPIFAKDFTYERVKERREQFLKQQESQPSMAGPLEDNPMSMAAADAANQVIAPGEAPASAKASSPDDNSSLKDALKMYNDGEFELARARLAIILERGQLSQGDEVSAREILANCLVALGQDQTAEHEFVRLLMLAPDYQLDPQTTSPKVLRVFRRAKGIQ